MLINVLMKSYLYFELNIKYLSLSQNELALSKNMQNSLKISDNIFKIADVQKLKFATSARDFIKTFKSVMSKSNAHVNAFI